MEAVEKDGKQPHTFGQDPKKRKLPDGMQAQRQVKHEDYPRTPKSSDQKKLYRNSETDGQKPSQLWSSEDEIFLASQFLRELKSSGTFPPKTDGNYWEELSIQLKGRLDVDRSKDQIYNKYRRMRVRYSTLTRRMQSSDSKSPNFKSSEEEKLYKILQELWADSKMQHRKPLFQRPMGVPSEQNGPCYKDINEDREEESGDEKVTEQTKLPLTSTGVKYKLKKTDKVSAFKIKAPEGDPMSREGNHNHVKGKEPSGQFKLDNVSDKKMSHGTLQALTLIEKVQNRFAKVLEEEHSHINDLFTKFKKGSDEKFELLLKLVSGLPIAGTFSPLMCGQISDGGVPLGILDLEIEKSVQLFQQQFSDQQSEEVKVSQKKLQLLQHFLDLKKEEQKSKLRINNSNL